MKSVFSNRFPFGMENRFFSQCMVFLRNQSWWWCAWSHLNQFIQIGFDNFEFFFSSAFLNTTHQCILFSLYATAMQKVANACMHIKTIHFANDRINGLLHLVVYICLLRAYFILNSNETTNTKEVWWTRK